ncbi:MAG: hypothetical protein ACK5HT_20700 [Draconibacterium sp.]
MEEVLKRLSDPVLSQRSIGIVTFSSAQQNLIEDLLNEALKNQPGIKKILEVDYSRGRAKEYYANFISAKSLKIESSLFHPSVSHRG